MTISTQQKIKGSLIGSAIGDGFGWPTEFLSLQQIQNQWGFNGLTEPPSGPIKVTDDTQMALAVAKALMQSWKEESSSLTTSDLTKAIRKEFITWLHDPENNRAPGMTCLGSCERLEKDLPWQEATNKTSKGCGANMRVLPVALMKFKNEHISQKQIAKWAQLQAAMTHAHPTALAATELTAITTIKIIEGIDSADLVPALLEHCHQQKGIYYEDILGDLWQRAGIDTMEMFINRGWEECINVLKQVSRAVKKGDKSSDPCIYTGEGWIAEEAFATALLCYLYFPNNSVAVLRRAVNTKGDSDSLACIAGSFVGAKNGIDSFPTDWVNRIEYQKEMNEFLSFLFK